MTLILGDGLGRTETGDRRREGSGTAAISARVYSSLRRLEDLFDRTRLNDFAAPHDRNIVGDDANDAEIVTDEDASEPELAVGRLEQGEDLRLH